MRCVRPNVRTNTGDKLAEVRTMKSAFLTGWDTRSNVRIEANLLCEVKKTMPWFKPRCSHYDFHTTHLEYDLIHSISQAQNSSSHSYLMANPRISCELLPSIPVTTLPSLPTTTKLYASLAACWTYTLAPSDWR